MTTPRTADDQRARMEPAWRGRRASAALTRAEKAVGELRGQGYTVLVFDDRDREVFTNPR